MKPILKCANCESRGIKQNLAKVTDTGEVIVQRFFAGTVGGNFTIIEGSDFVVRCGLCGEVAFKRERRQDDRKIPSVRVVRVSGFQTITTFGTVGTPSN